MPRIEERQQFREKAVFDVCRHQHPQRMPAVLGAVLKPTPVARTAAERCPEGRVVEVLGSAAPPARQFAEPPPVCAAA